jgi:hypothetical protein
MTATYESPFSHSDHHLTFHALSHHTTLVLRTAEHLLHAGHQLAIKRSQASFTFVELTERGSWSPCG